MYVGGNTFLKWLCVIIKAFLIRLPERSHHVARKTLFGHTSNHMKHVITQTEHQQAERIHLHEISRISHI